MTRAERDCKIAPRYSADNRHLSHCWRFYGAYRGQSAKNGDHHANNRLLPTLLPLSIAPAGANNAAAKIHKVFDIVRGGDKIGTDTIDIERQNDTTTVKIKTDVSVKVMFIEAYRYEHSCNETWKNGQLIAFKSRTNDNGTKHSIDVTAGAGQAEHGRRRQA